MHSTAQLQRPAGEGLSEVMETAALPNLLCETTTLCPMPAPVVLLFGPVIIILVKFKGEISPPKIHLSVVMLKSVFVD